jgi:hypothetical protein
LGHTQSFAFAYRAFFSSIQLAACSPQKKTNYNGKLQSHLLARMTRMTRI